MDIFKLGTRPTTRARADWFTGNVLMEPVVTAPEPARLQAVRVSFEPGARTAWHTHPLGQTLYILSGVGLIGLRGQPPQIMQAGDTVWIPPSEEHWHGAAPDSAMCHLAMQEAQDGRTAIWMELVSDEDYLGEPE